MLNKSAVVLLVACWEAYVEDLPATAFDYVLAHASSHSVFSPRVLGAIGRQLKGAANDLEPWTLAGAGWQAVMTQHKASTLARYVGKLNTPKPAQVDSLFDEMLGLAKLADCWHWRGVNAQQARDRLGALVELRGEIAHRVEASQSVTKIRVRRSAAFIGSLAECSSNRVRDFVHQQVGSHPWIRVEVNMGR